MIKPGEKVMDSRESGKFAAEGLNRGFVQRVLTFRSHTDDMEKFKSWIRIAGRPDCGDFANEKAIIESKTLSDMLNADHTIFQLQKATWTGKYVALLVRDYYNHRYKLRKAGVSEYHVNANEHRVQCSAARIRIPVFYCTDINEAYRRIEWFLEHCDEAPKPINTFNQYQGKFTAPLVMLCGIPGMGESHARLFLQTAGSFAMLSREVYELEEPDFIEKYTATKGLGPAYCRRLLAAFKEPVE